MDTTPEHLCRQAIHRLSLSTFVRRMGDGLVGVVSAASAGVAATCGGWADPDLRRRGLHWRRIVLPFLLPPSCGCFPHDCPGGSAAPLLTFVMDCYPGDSAARAGGLAGAAGCGASGDQPVRGRA